jgi:hypothetical protein
MDRKARSLSARARLGFCCAGVLAFGVVASAESNVPSLDEIARGYGLSDADVKKMRAGGRAGGELEAASNNELSLSVGFYSSKAVDWHQDRLIESRSADHTILAWQAIETPNAAAFSKIELPPDELKWLAEVEPGEDANFSTEEIALLRASRDSAKGAAQDAALLETFREILAGRTAAYLKRGLKGVAPYDRGDGEIGDPADHLAKALAELKITQRVAPSVYDAIASFPKPPGEGVRSTVYWVLHDANDRVIVALGHRAFGVNEGRLVALDRRFYVSHTLNSMQAVAVAIPLENGTAVLYANRTATDLITGFASGIAKKIGRTLMRSEIGRILDQFQIEAGDP